MRLETAPTGLGGNAVRSDESRPGLETALHWRVLIYRDPDLSGETAPTKWENSRGGLECLINSKIYYSMIAQIEDRHKETQICSPLIFLDASDVL